MAKGLQIAEPPKRKSETADPVHEPPAKGRGGKFDQVAGTQKVQFNKRVHQSVADGFDMLAIKTKRKVPELLAEALELLEQKYGKI